MTLKDPRWRIIIHYNWKAQLVPVLVNGLPSKARAAEAQQGDQAAAAERAPDGRKLRDWRDLPMPSAEAVQAVSPHAHIVRGAYHTPTFIVHGDQDELIPWQQSREAVGALRARGVEAGLAVPRGAGHAFDLWSDEDPLGTGWAAVTEGYDFICRHLF